jgi:predicted DNA-binding transcriptional regulator AlpA
VSLAVIPTLGQLDADKLAALPVEIVKRLAAKHAAVGEPILARLIAAPTTEPNGDGSEEQLVGTPEVAEMLGRGKSWVEHHLDDLPPRRSLLGQPVWLRRDIEAWIKNLPKYGHGS